MNQLDRQEGRAFLTDNLRKAFDFRQTDQNQGVPMPPASRHPFKPLIPLPEPAPLKAPLGDVIKHRSSLRQFGPGSVSLEALSAILEATQGVRETVGDHVLRYVPSAGNRHALELYLIARRVDNLEPGIYRYYPLSHGLEPVAPPLAEEALTQATLGQAFLEHAPLTLIYSAVPYRMEWRYGPTSYRVLLMDAGHAMQNAILAGEALGLGSCPVAAYDQQAMDVILGIDGSNELTLYLAAMGPRP